MNNLYWVVLVKNNKCYPYMGINKTNGYDIRYWSNIDCYSYSVLSDAVKSSYNSIDVVAPNVIGGVKVLCGIKEQYRDYVLSNKLIGTREYVEDIYDRITVSAVGSLDIRVVSIERFGLEIDVYF